MIEFLMIVSAIIAMACLQWQLMSYFYLLFSLIALYCLVCCFSPNYHVRRIHAPYFVWAMMSLACAGLSHIVWSGFKV